MQTLDFDLRGDVITLDRLLKAVGMATSGGSAKLMVAEGRVQVDGRQELRKTAQIRAGQVVAVHGTRIRVRAAVQPGAAPEGQGQLVEAVEAVEAAEYPPPAAPEG